MEDTKYCFRCGEQMEFVSKEVAEWDDSVTVIMYKCPYCGATHTATTPEEESKGDYPFYNGEDDYIENVSHGYDGFCLQCGSHIVWQSDFMRSEVWGDIDYTEEGKKIIEGLEQEIKKVQDEINKNPDGDNTDLIEKRKDLSLKLSIAEYDYIDSEDDSLASYCMCPHCGTYHEIVDAKPSEYSNYPLYNEEKD